MSNTMMLRQPRSIFSALPKSSPARSRPSNHRRHLHTTYIRRRPIANSPFPDLLQRDPSRNLPTLASISPRRKWLYTMPIFAFCLITSALGIFNYQKTQSPIITATLYALRTNSSVREVLGDEVYFASKWAWIWGHINFVKGNIDVSFKVGGTRGTGWCRFKARRLGGKGGEFKTDEWSLTTEDGRVIQLLEGTKGIDPVMMADV